MPFAALMYHSLSDGRFPDTQHLKYTTTRARFDEHLRVLIGEGFQLDSVAGLHARIAAREALPPRYCVLTFDDGHRSSLDLAEILTRHGVSGTFFATMKYCRELPDFLRESELRELASAGFDLGTHGVTHRALAHLPREQMRDELATSKAWLEDLLGKGVESMSLPAGEGDTEVYRSATAAGYLLVANSRERMNDAGAALSMLDRFVVLAHCDQRLLRRLATGDPTYIWSRRLRAAALALPKRILRSYDATRS